MLRVFIGFDRNETVAFHVLANSIRRQASEPVAITPLVLSQLPLKRPRDAHQSTEFAFSRFLVPWLCGYEGSALFLDCDMLCRRDVAELFSAASPVVAVSVVKHNYAPVAGPKFLDQPQSLYARKNWSSVMLFNNASCRALSPEYVDSASGLDLHQFNWLAHETLIGALDPSWNHLVGEYEPDPDAKIVHFTRGTPCFAKFSRCEFAGEWHAERAMVLDYNKFGEFSLPERVSA